MACASETVRERDKPDVRNMAQRFDVLIIGTGAAASAAAARCRKADRSVAIVDELPFGGTCALRGCDPKKVLRRGAEVVNAAYAMREHGIVPGGLKVDWPALIAFKRSFTEPVQQQRLQSFEQNGIAAFCGTAHFLGETTVGVGDQRFEGRHVVIATGAKPRPLGISGEELVTTSADFMELRELPRRVLFIGGGYISFEFAHMAARSGADATILNRGKKPLAAFDPDLVDRLVERSAAAGIRVHGGAEVNRVERTGQGLRVHASVDGREQQLTADLVVHGAGRVPATISLNLDAAGISAEKNGIVVNEYLQSVSNPFVYAAGDVAATAGPPLTPVSSLEGDIAAANLLEGNDRQPDYTGIPSVVYTIPPLARVGLLESEARAQGYNFTSKCTDMSGWYAVRRVGETLAAARVLVEDGSGRILGAHLFSPDSGELINLFALAMRSGLNASDLKNLISAYPSAASDISHLI